jgi:hypothetical protein
MDKKMYSGMEESNSYLKKGMKDEKDKVQKVAMMKAAMKAAKNNPMMKAKKSK